MQAHDRILKIYDNVVIIIYLLQKIKQEKEFDGFKGAKYGHKNEEIKIF